MAESRRRSPPTPRGRARTDPEPPDRRLETSHPTGEKRTCNSTRARFARADLRRPHKVHAELPNSTCTYHSRSDRCSTHDEGKAQDNSGRWVHNRYVLVVCNRGLSH